MESPNEVKVWDPFVRLFHWILLGAFLICYITQGKPRWLHVNSGYVIAVLVVSRILWGFVGPRHARFRDFIYSPRAIFNHLMDVARLKARRYLGHDPAGGAMIVTLLLTLSVSVLTGMLLHGSRDKAGPFAGYSAEMRWELPAFVQTAYASRGETGWKQQRGGRMKTPGEKWLEEVHEVFANIALALSIVHVCGVVAVSLQTRENLILGMITGRKKKSEG